MSIRACAPHLGRPSEQLIAALLPDVTAPRPTPRPVSLPTLPVLSLPRLHDPDTLLVGAARVDRSGRIHERAVLRALGWEPGHELELDTANDMIAIASVPGGRHHVDDRGALALPAAARRMCGITIGRPVILLAAVHQQILLVYPAAIVAGLLAARYTTLMGARDAR
jgi:bifunctional DNA-binding transcriptional regulator/antitoxin component of YhaV-PrlF toxin-antitoxin module